MTRQIPETIRIREKIDHDLLVRIDERQAHILTELKDLKNSQKNYVCYDDDYKDVVTKVGTLWDMRNKMLGYSAATGALGAVILQVIFKFWK